MSNIYKKLLALMLSATLIFTAIPMIVSANSATTTTVSIPTYKNIDGSEINVLHTSTKALPSSVLSYKSGSAQLTTNVVENTTHLPLTNLFAFEHPVGVTGWSEATIHIDGAAGRGALFYVEAPVKEGGFRVSIYMVADNAEKYATGTSTLYYLGEEDSTWQAQTAKQYGILLESGFKGYIYIPFEQLTGGTGIANGQIVSAMELWMAGSAIDSGRLCTPEGYPLVISAPMIVEGNATDPTLPAADKFTANGQEFYYFDANRPKYFNENADLSTLRTPEVSGDMLGSSAGIATEWDSITFLSELPSAKVSGFTPPENATNDSNTLVISYDLAVKSEANTAASGIMIYVRLTNVDNPSFYFTAGSYSDASDTATRVYSNSRYSGRTIYYLESGTTEWKESNPSTSSSPYWCEIPETGNFEGYIYYPWDSSSKPNDMPTVLLDTFAVYINKNPISETTGVAEDIYISAPILVDGFCSEEMVICKDSVAIDMVTGEYVNFDYSSAKPFYGNSSLVSSPTADMLELETADMKTSAYSLSTPVLSAGNFDTGDTDNITVSYVSGRTPVINAPTLSVSVGEAAVEKSRLLDINMNNAFAGTEGVMLYVENPAETAVSLNFGLKAADTTTSKSITWRKDRRIRSFTSGADEWSDLAISSDGLYSILPAGFKGYLYLDYDNFVNTVTAYLEDGTLTAITINAVIAAGQMLYVGTPMRVINYAEDITGMAMVNGSTIAQDMFTGSFAVPYDIDGDLIADERNSATQTAIDMSVNFDPLTASGDSLLVGNPDRGYRTELVLYIKQGSPIPIYSDGAKFTSLSDAEAYIDALALTEGTVDLIQIGSGNDVYKTTMNTEDTLVVDVVRADSGTGDGDYRVYRAFSSSSEASYFTRGSLSAKGQAGYTWASSTVTTPTGEAETVYRIKYDDRAVFTDWDEATSKAKLNQIFRIYFKTTDPYDNNSAIDQSNLFLAYVYITDWNGSTAADTTKVEELSTGALASIKYFFQVCEDRNVKSMLRFCYNDSFARNQALTETQPDNRLWLAEQCANEATIIRHTEQLASVVSAYKHTIHTISNGFVGYVGEWAYSYQYPLVNYNTVTKAIVENLCVPNGLYFSARLPKYKQAILDEDPDYPYADYISHNNDALYGEQTHIGWNSEGFQLGNPNGYDTDWWQYLTDKAAYTPQGGELYVIGALVKLNSDGTLDEANSKIPTGLEVILEMAHHRHTSLSYWHGYLEALGNQYNILKGWMNEEITPAQLEGNNVAYDPNWFVDANGNAVTRNAYEFIRDHLGYRISLQNAEVTWSGRSDEKATVQLALKNYGFAAAFNLTSGFVILDSDYNVVSDIQAGNPDTWYSLDPDYYTNGYVSTSEHMYEDILTHTVEAELTLPTEAGNYHIAFYAKNTMNDFARLANDMTVQDGYHILGSFTIQ